ncbi:MAG: DUF3592 domain-containing protein [Planctomycetota bacterium]
MSFQIACPACSRRLKIADEQRGKQVKCPCGKILAIDAAAPSPPKPKSASLVVACPCGVKLKVGTQSAGKQVQCPKCQRRLSIKGSAVPKSSPAGSPASAAVDPFVAKLGSGDDPFAAMPEGGTSRMSASAQTSSASSPAAPGESVAWDELPSNPAGPAFPSAPAGTFPSSAAMPVSAASPSAFPAAQAPSSSSHGQRSREEAALAAAGGYTQSAEEREVSAGGGGDGGFEFNRLHIALIVMFFVGPAMCFFGIKNMMHRRHIEATGIKTVGVVTDGWEKRGRKGRRSYHLEVAWQTEGGSKYDGTFSVSSGYYDEVLLNMPIPVQYDKENPGDCILLDDRDTSMVTVVLGAVIFLVSIGGISWTLYSQAA